jgi:hypothetical protein
MNPFDVKNSDKLPALPDWMTIAPPKPAFNTAVPALPATMSTALKTPSLEEYLKTYPFTITNIRNPEPQEAGEQDAQISQLD